MIVSLSHSFTHSLTHTLTPLLTRQAWDLMVVLEEDALVVAGFHRRLREVLCDLPATWDVLYLNAHHAGNLSVTPRDPRHATEQVTRGALLYKVARVVRFFHE